MIILILQKQKTKNFLYQNEFEEIYSHFQIPEDDNANSVFTTTYTLQAKKEIKKAKKEVCQNCWNKNSIIC